MINHPFAGKGRSSNQNSALRITPSNSPSARSSSRSPIKTNLSPPILALEHVIGATTTSPSGFSCHEQSRTIALCAGSTAVLTQFDDEFHIHQRFYRAAPTVVAANTTTSSYGTPSHIATPERRRHSIAPRASVTPFAGPGSPSKELYEHDPFKTWTSRKRIKTVSCVAISPDGKFLAVGEVMAYQQPISTWSLMIADRLQPPDPNIFHQRRCVHRHTAFHLGGAFLRHTKCSIQCRWKILG